MRDFSHTFAFFKKISYIIHAPSILAVNLLHAKFIIAQYLSRFVVLVDQRTWRAYGKHTIGSTVHWWRRHRCCWKQRNVEEKLYGSKHSFWENFIICCICHSLCVFCRCSMKIWSLILVMTVSYVISKKAWLTFGGLGSTRTSFVGRDFHWK